MDGFSQNDLDRMEYEEGVAEGRYLPESGAHCPRCSSIMHPTLVMNALSRVDNATYICSACGQDEAMFNFKHPGEPLPAVDRLVYW